jgi:hypothetical protein
VVRHDDGGSVVCVLGAIALALTVDVAALIGWLRRRREFLGG